MIHQQTIDTLQQLRLYNMAKSYSERRQQPDHQDLSFDEFLGLIVEDEYLARTNKRIKRLIQQAKFRYPSASFQDIDYSQKRGISKVRLANLQNSEWIDKSQNLFFTGPTGIGKSYLACAFGSWACRHGYSVLYYRWARLLTDLLASRGDGSYLKFLKKLSKINVLIIDDFGLSSITDLDRRDLLEIVEERYMNFPTIFSSQLPVDSWHEYFQDPTIADAICDRLFHFAHRIELSGDTMRKKFSNLD